MKRTLSLILLALSLSPLAALADVAPPVGMHEFSTTAAFDNLADYPGYDFYAYDSGAYGPYAIPVRDEATTVQQQMIPHGHLTRILSPYFAVKKSDQATIVHRIDPEQPESGDIWQDLPENKPYMIPGIFSGAGALLQGQEQGAQIVPDQNPAIFVIWVYHIDSVTDTSFTVHFVRETHYDENGTLVASPVYPNADSTTSAMQPTTANQNNAAPIAAPASSAPYMWIAIVGLGAVLLAVAFKAWKK